MIVLEPQVIVWAISVYTTLWNFMFSVIVGALVECQHDLSNIRVRHIGIYYFLPLFECFSICANIGSSYFLPLLTISQDTSIVGNLCHYSRSFLYSWKCFKIYVNLSVTCGCAIIWILVISSLYWEYFGICIIAWATYKYTIIWFGRFRYCQDISEVHTTNSCVSPLSERLIYFESFEGETCHEGRYLS